MCWATRKVLYNVHAEDGCRLWTEVAGDGAPLIFCHGGPGLWDMFGELAPGLGSVARTIRWDQRGGGRSERRGPYGVGRSVADLDAVRREHAGSAAALVGHSWGATLALRYALAYPDRVTRLVYVSGTGIDAYSTWHDAYERNLRARVPDLPTAEKTREAAIQQWTADFADPATAPADAERIATPWFEVNYECNAAINAETRNQEDLTEQCRALRVPVLIVDGDADIRPRSAVDSLAAALPDVRRVMLAGAGHVPWIERPAEIRQAISTFLTEER
jgi:proline iminopeptidase